MRLQEDLQCELPSLVHCILLIYSMKRQYFSNKQTMPCSRLLLVSRISRGPSSRMWSASEAMRAVFNIIEQRTRDQRRQRGACSSPLAPERRFASFTTNVHEPLLLRDLPASAKMPHCNLPATTWSRLSHRTRPCCSDPWRTNRRHSLSVRLHPAATEDSELNLIIKRMKQS